MTDECSNPITRQTISKHWIVVFAGGDHVVLRDGARAGQEGGEGNVGDGSGVAMAGKRDDLGDFCEVVVSQRSIAVRLEDTYQQRRSSRLVE